MKKWLKRLLWLLLVLLLLLVGVVAWGLGTERGMVNLLSLAQQHVPGKLEIKQASGRLSDALALEGVSYAQDDGMALKAAELDFAWNPKALLSRRLELEHLTLTDVDIHLPPTVEPAEKSSSAIVLPDVRLPLAIRVGELDLKNIRIYPYTPTGESEPILVDSVRLAAAAEGETLQVLELHGMAPQGEVSLSGTVQPVGSYPLDLALNWRFSHPDIGEFRGRGSVTGDLENTHLTHSIEGAAKIDVEADVSQVLTSPSWDASVKLAVDNLGFASADLEGAPLTANITSKGSLESFTASGQMHSDTAQTGPVAVDFSAEGDLNHLDIQQAVVQLVNSPTRLGLTGGIDLQSLAMDIKGDWNALKWPLLAQKEVPTGSVVSSEKGTFSLQGPVDDYRFSLQADAMGDAIPPGQWQLDGEGSDKELGGFHLLGKVLEGSLDITGKAAWKPEPAWDVKLISDGINPGAKWTDFPGKLSSRIQSKGRVQNGIASLTASIDELQGMLRGYPLQGTGKLQLNGKKVLLDNIAISSGDTQLKADGEVDQTLDVTWSLVAPDLATLLPDMKGAVNSQGRLAGRLDAPAVDMALKISGLDVSGTRIEALEGKADIDVSGGTTSTVDFHGKGLRLAGQSWEKLAIKGEGTPDKHTLKLSLGGELAQLAMAVNGGLNKGVWQGVLDQLQATKTEFGDWQLKQPVEVSGSPQQASAKALCLVSKPTELCLEGQWKRQGASSGVLRLSGLDPARFKEYLPVGMTLESQLEGEVTGEMNASGEIDAKADLVLTPGHLKVASEVSPLDMALGESRLKARLKNKRLDGSAHLDLGEMGRADASAIVTGLLAGKDGAPLVNASLKADIDNLSPVGKLVPDLEEVTGRVLADLAFKGELQEPAITGELKLEDFGAEVPVIALRLQDTQFVAKSSGKGPLLMDGVVRSGQGELALSGQLNPETRALELALKGDGFQVADSDKIRAVISPDMKISMDSKGMAIRGLLKIPSAYVNAGGSDSEGTTVAASKDLVLVDENGELKEKSQGGNMNVNLRIELGDDIKVEAPGFSGALKGSLLVEQTPQLAPRGTGTIEIVSGDYVVYGQKLTMQRGRVLFSGGPVDNPKLDLDVARQVEAYDVLAGAKIRGTAQAPQLTLYSEPSMPDASILSYMLLGQPPGTKGGSYTLGKYLTPDLYVSYGIGLFDAANSFNMRYKLTDKLAVQAASGLASSADLIYTFER